jgi:hypothetical protein
MERPWEMTERDHVIQDPTSPEKIRLLGEYVRLLGRAILVARHALTRGSHVPAMADMG